MVQLVGVGLDRNTIGGVVWLVVGVVWLLVLRRTVRSTELTVG